MNETVLKSISTAAPAPPPAPESEPAPAPTTTAAATQPIKPLTAREALLNGSSGGCMPPQNGHADAAGFDGVDGIIDFLEGKMSEAVSGQTTAPNTAASTEPTLFGSPIKNPIQVS